MCLNIRASTVEGYITAAAKLWTDRSLQNPFKPAIKSLLKVNYVQVIIEALKRYEGEEDRKEIITDGMFLWIKQHAEKQTSEDCLERAIFDWLVWGRYGGPRRSEWCQTKKEEYEPAFNAPEGECAAFRDDDACFYDREGRQRDVDCITEEELAISEMRWRYQKNGVRNEKIPYAKDDENPDWCAALAMHRIAKRARRLGVKKHEPIGKYRDARDGKVYFITDTQVTELLRKAAKIVLGITDERLLEKWATHSVRITAANELHRNNFSEPFIKKRLRWLSDSFMKYLRNTIHVARLHTLGLAKSSITARESEKDVPLFRAPSDQDILWEIPR